jgi:hypothetical protein
MHTSASGHATTETRGSRLDAEACDRAAWREIGNTGGGSAPSGDSLPPSNPLRSAALARPAAVMVIPPGPHRRPLPVYDGGQRTGKSAAAMQSR